MEKIDLDAVAREPNQGHTSKGDQPKWQWQGKWYKADYMGYEALSEVLISRLLKQSNVSGFVEYGPVWIRYRGKELSGCVSDNFRDKDEMLVPLERLYRCLLYTSPSPRGADNQTEESRRISDPAAGTGRLFPERGSSYKQSGGHSK